MASSLLPKLSYLPSGLPEGSIGIVLEEGIVVFRASQAVQDRIEDLLEKQRDGGVSEGESHELDCYAEIDDYLSFVNRTMRNLAFAEMQKAS